MNKKILWISLAFLILYSTPQLLRDVYLDGNLIGFTTYFHERSAENLLQGQFYDNLSFGGRPYTYPPGFHVLLALLMPIGKYLVPLFGAIGIVVCYFFSKQIGLSEKEATLASVFLGIIPGFFYLSSHINPRLPALVALVAAFYFLQKTEMRDKLAAALLLSFVFLLHPLVGFTGLVFGAVLFNKNKIAIPYAIALGAFALWFIPFTYANGLPMPSEFYSNYSELQRGVQYFIYETGTAGDSVGIIMLAIAAFGLFKVSGKEERTIARWFVLAVVAALVLGNRLDEQILFPTAILMSIVISRHLADFEKSFNLNKFIARSKLKMLFSVYCIGLVAAVFINMTTFMPYQNDYHALQWIKLNTPQDAVVASAWELGHWVTGIAERKNIIDAYAEYAPEIDERYKDVQNIFFSSDVDEVLPILRKYNITYIYYRVTELNHCSGLPFLTRSGYLDTVFQEASADGRSTSLVFKIEYSGTNAKQDLCSSLIASSK
ncbi:MAG: hypothetical protein J4432_00610 [DPANN group archaeon]|nr:hypothetical protein [DPANN group archaeon]